MRKTITIFTAVIMFLSCFGLSGGPAFAEETPAPDTEQAEPLVQDPVTPPEEPLDNVNDAQGEPKASGEVTDSTPNTQTEQTEQTETTTQEATTEAANVKHKVTGLKARSVQFRQIRLTWNKDETYKGSYTIYRIIKGKAKKIGTTKKNSFIVKNLTPGSRYTFKVKADVLSGAVSRTVIVMKNAKLTLVKSGKYHWELRTKAKQKSFKYDTIQGACAFNGIAYMTLYNRNVEKIKIVKVRLRDMKVLKVSKALKGTCHANTITYDTKRNRLVMPKGKSDKKRIVFVNPKTLKVTGQKKLNIKRSKLGVKYKGISGLAYNRAKKQYFLKVMGNSSKVVRLSRSFGSQKKIPITKNISALMSQGLYTDGGYLYDLQSFDGGLHYNLITIRTLSGKMVGRVKIPQGKGKNIFELECLFRDEKTNQWYIGMYRSIRSSKGDIKRQNYIYKLENIW